MTKSSLVKALRKREDVMETLERIEHFVREIDAKAEPTVIEVRLTALEELQATFQQLHDEIILNDIEENRPDNRQQKDLFDDRYLTAKARLMALLKPERKHADVSPGRMLVEHAPRYPTGGVRLPQLTIPIFDGKYDSWHQFHDMFVALVHGNDDITAIEKLCYLKSYLKGEALKVIEAFPVSGVSYAVAFEALVKRYANIYVQKKRHVNELLQWPRMTTMTKDGIHDLIDAFDRHTKLLDQLGENTSRWGVLLTELLVSKLDDTTRRLWETHVEQEDRSETEDLIQFLQSQTRILDATAAGRFTSGRQLHRRVAASVSAETSSRKCGHCDGSHFIASCPAFAELNILQREQLVKQKKLCINCLTRGHLARECRSNGRCRICSRKHHSLLHSDSPARDELPVREQTEVASVTPTAHSTQDPVRGHVLLCTAGAQVNIVTEDLHRRLKLPSNGPCSELRGVGKCRIPTTTSIDAVIKSRTSNYQQRVEFAVMPRIMGHQPSTSLNIDKSKLPTDVTLADPTFDVTGRIDMLLGSEFYGDFLMTSDDNNVQLRKATGNLPMFINSVFGWVASGKVPCNIQRDLEHHNNALHVEPGKLLERQIERFWMIEEIPEATKRSQEEEDCEDQFTQQHSRDEYGRYVVKLPFKEGGQQLLGESRRAAERRFLQLERRFSRNPALKEEYAAVITDYIQRGYLRKVLQEDQRERDEKACYLPHHPVIKESSTTTKVRPVFDGSSKTSTDFSLNDVLLNGPVIQDSLMELLLRFRMHPIALVADIEKMYLQVKVHPDHQPLQRILWRTSPSVPLDTFELQRVTFGLKPSSFLATRVLHQLAEDEGTDSRAKKALLKDFYVDDYIGGAETEEEAIQLQKGLDYLLLQKGGFHLHKWNSNSVKVLEKVAAVNLAHNQVLKLDKESHIRTLGIAWQTASDQLFVEADVPDLSKPLTKRRIYSITAKLFNPLGLVAPITVWAKIKMQQLWISGLDWDEPLPLDASEIWKTFHTSLPMLSQLKIPRFASMRQAVSTQLHCFADASEAAYGAVIYVKTIDQGGRVKVEILAAKSKLAPIKKISLPRLELCAAMMAAKLWTTVSKALNMENVVTIFWTDSMIVQHWLRAPSYTWATYVANRVSLIQETTSQHRWLHVKGSDNPADIVSRGALPKDLLKADNWFHGPAWLSQDESQWKTDRSTEMVAEDLLERRKTSIAVATINKAPTTMATNYSCYWKYLRMMAFCLRFSRRCQKKQVSGSTLLTVKEIMEAEKKIIGKLQQDYFVQEIKELSANRALPTNSRLRGLRPFLDADKLLRLGGRLAEVDVPYSTKHPLLLPDGAHLTRLIAEDYHRRTLHGGPRMTLAAMRREFWPVKGRRIINHVCRNCQACFKARPNIVVQPTGQLPTARTTPARPFSIVGVDFGGPFYLKPAHRRAASQKAYLAVFVCFVVKAVHLEIVEDLSTSAFLAAFRRFISRRGLPAKVYSDNGLNFQGANNELQGLYELLNKPQSKEIIQAEAARSRIEWHFIPPRAPNFGGLWEAAVKSAKATLRKIVGAHRLTYAELETVFDQVEAQMNSRPLTPLSEDPAELDVLTPGHFLIGTSLLALPESDITHIPENRLKRFQLIQQLAQHHWKRWKREYLGELHNSNQRRISPKQLHIGNMVLLKEENTASCEWPLGRIIKVHPGNDGIVRVVVVRTKSGEFKRPVSKICVLPFDDDNVNSKT